ncbi:iron chaperone [Mucilaginibacter limnophilus]|nr:DUF1801 domain-containing protein [Mucilaginibacter limnophilus]
MKKAAEAPGTVDEYIAQQAPAFRPQLEKLRTIIKSELPDAKEMMSYGVPCFHYYMLMAIGVTKKYCSLYAMSPPLLKQLKADIKDLKITGSTIHFEPDDALPEQLIRKAVAFRAKQNEEKASAKKKKAK